MNNGATSPGGGIGGFFLGMLVGAVAGGIAAMLFSPQSGPQTRGLLKDEVTKTQNMLQSWADDIRQRADEFGQIIRFTAEREAQQVRGNGKNQEERTPG